MLFSTFVVALLVVLLVCATALAGWSETEEPKAVAGGEPGRFRAGAAASNITPRLGVSINGYFNDRVARHIHDELHARCLVLDDGKTRLAIVACDSCMIPRAVVEAARERIQERTGLPGSHVLISATHTHTAPACAGIFQSEPDEEYSAFLINRIADGVERAVNNLAPAKIAWGAGRMPDQVFNRRWKMKPGAIQANPFGGTNDLVKMNPPVESPDLVEPAGPTDPEISILAVQSPAGRPIALLASYSLHYVGTGRDLEVSADYYGVFCDRIQELLGADDQDPPFVALLANGASGDINNINFRKKQPARQPYEQVNLVADAVAREAHRVYQTLQFRDKALLGVAEKGIKVGVRMPNAAEIARAKQILAQAKGRELRGLEEVYARETMWLKDYPKEMPLVLQTLRIGDLGIAAIPCEVFVEIGLAIKAKSPFQQTFTIGLANGCHGYLPTAEQHKLGGYETWRARSSCLEVNAAPKIFDTIMKMFAGLK
jgi:neutral ceramidase